MLERLAHAKINLRLCVLAQERSGYHQIETLLCRISLADRLVVENADGLTLDVDGEAAGPLADNIVLRAARAFYDRTGLRPAASFRLTKRIPAGTGLGGGSSDAAATLHLLNQLHEVRLDRQVLLEIGSSLGSDIPFFVSEAAFALAWGRGERILVLDALPRRPVLVAVPAERMPTARAYGELARSRIEAQAASRPAVVEGGMFGSWPAVEGIATNDFESVVGRVIPAVPALQAILARSGARVAQLTGSGSAVFGLFDDESACESAAREVQASQSGVLLIQTTTG